MTKPGLLGIVAVIGLGNLACNSKNASLETRDGAVDQVAGTGGGLGGGGGTLLGGSTGNGGTTALGAGGGGGTALPGTGGKVGTGGFVGTGGPKCGDCRRVFSKAVWRDPFR